MNEQKPDNTAAVIGFMMTVVMVLVMIILINLVKDPELVDDYLKEHPGFVAAKTKEKKAVSDTHGTSSVQPAANVQSAVTVAQVPVVAGSHTKSDPADPEMNQLMQQSGCIACHRVDSKIIGPSYLEVAAKYTSADISHLVEKVQKGGSGVWGQIPMTPNAHIPPANIQKLVTWIVDLQ